MGNRPTSSCRDHRETGEKAPDRRARAAGPVDRGSQVPKPGGGNYWFENTEKSRYIDRKGEANKEETSRIVYDFLRTLGEHRLFAQGHTPDSILGNPTIKKDIFDSLIGGITEYGRMVLRR